jgi:hypothetical protein
MSKKKWKRSDEEENVKEGGSGSEMKGKWIYRGNEN